MRTLIIVTMALLLVPSATAKDKEAKPKTPEQAQALSDAAPTTTFTSRPATAAEALAASEQPNAVTEIAPGMTAAEATGAEPGIKDDLAITQEVEDDGGGPGDSYYKLCRFGTLAAQWGTWPYDQHVYDNTYWCWNSSSLNLTYRSTYVTTDGALCGTDDTYTFKYAGGIGFPYVYLEAGAYFSCDTTVPWITLHFRRCLHDVWYPYGARTDAYGCFG